MIFSYSGLSLSGKHSTNLPVLLIMDGHGTHISIELIELARCNDIHLLCLPSHNIHPGCRHFQVIKKQFFKGLQQIC